jgi:hypothetical protein
MSTTSKLEVSESFKNLKEAMKCNSSPSVISKLRKDLQSKLLQEIKSPSYKNSSLIINNKQNNSSNHNYYHPVLRGANSDEKILKFYVKKKYNQVSNMYRHNLNL